MARDRDLLSDREFFRKTSDIAEHMRKCDIDVVFWDNDNSVVDKNLDGKHFILNVATPAVKGIEKFTAFNHELGHIIMNTPIPEAKELVDKWMNMTGKEDEGFHGLRRSIYWDVMNVLEDQRIESLMSKLWLANEKRFIKARTNRGKLHNECNNNPVNILLNIRFFREDLASEHKYFEEYKQALEDVHGLGRLGALIILKKIKPILDEWLNNGESKDPSVVEPYSGKDVNRMSHKPELITDDPSFIDDIKDFKDAIDNSRIDGKNNLELLKSSMSDDDGKIKKPKYLEFIERYEEDFSVDNSVAHNLKRVFRNISEIPKNTIGYNGNEIDIESYIEGKIRGYDINNCFIDKKLSHGLSVVISIDGSHSMKTNGRIEGVRNLVATLFESVKDYKNIEIKANVWSSDAVGSVGVTEINSLKECSKITTNSKGGYCMTPTHLALDFASKILKRMKGRKKLLILITDGQPQYQSWGHNIAAKTLLKMNKKAALKAKRHAHELVVLSVGVDRWAGRILQEVFGKNKVVNVVNMDDGGIYVANKFKTAVLDTLK